MLAASEIARERYALKALRGDLRPVEMTSGCEREDTALATVNT